MRKNVTKKYSKFALRKTHQRHRFMIWKY